MLMDFAWSKRCDRKLSSWDACWEEYDFHGSGFFLFFASKNMMLMLTAASSSLVEATWVHFFFFLSWLHPDFSFLVCNAILILHLTLLYMYVMWFIHETLVFSLIPKTVFAQILGLQYLWWWFNDSPRASGIILCPNLYSHFYHSAALLYASSLI